MPMSDTTTATGAQAPAAPERPPRNWRPLVKWIVLSLLLLLLLGGAGGGVWWFFFHKPAVEASEGEGGEGEGEAAAAPAKPTGDGIVAMEPFLVNLADKDASRFLRVTLRLVVETKKEATEISENEVARTRLRSAVLELLTQQLAQTLTTAEGKEQLKKAIAERATRVLGDRKVLDVLFTDFVVQF